MYGKRRPSHPRRERGGKGMPVRLEEVLESPNLGHTLVVLCAAVTTAHSTCFKMAFSRQCCKVLLGERVDQFLVSYSFLEVLVQRCTSVEKAQSRVGKRAVRSRILRTKERRNTI